MATAKLTIRISEMTKFRELVWSLRMLGDRMRVEASPHAEDLERALDRFFLEGRPDELEDKFAVEDDD